MCGIAGFLAGSAASADELSTGVEAMTVALSHRGPDASAFWLDQDAGMALGHRRLSIIDLSETGAQPMVSECGRYVISYNGEIYNFQEMRETLEAAGHHFRGSSDTEVVLAACSEWGIEKAVLQLIGMFAIALWDRQEKQLFLIRDRLGIKPVYWTDTGKSFLFASELKALRAHPSFRVEINHGALAGFLRRGYIAAPRTIYRGVYKLMPGEMLTIAPKGEPKVSRYWSLAGVVREGAANPFEGSEADAEEALDALLRDAVGRRMVADVPLGVFLSGGVDSSLVTALMQAQSGRPVKTFSIGFEDDDYDEAGHAQAVAAHLGTEHTEHYVGPQEALDVVPHLAEMYDEPFADPSQIPTYLISKLARQSVSVALSGDGGDELFGGYNRYLAAARFGPLLFNQPGALRDIESAMLGAIPPAGWEFLAKALPASKRPRQLGQKMQKLSGVLAGGVEEFYRNVTGHWEEPSTMVIGASSTPLPYDPKEAEELLPDAVERMQYLDSLSYLPDDILTKVDRASMAVSLEVRVPLIDHRVAAFAWSLPKAWKIKPGRSKRILRGVLERYVPAKLIERPKSGFTVPIDAWLRGPLRDWAASLLDESRLRGEGYFKPEPIRRKWEEHLAGKRNWQSELWDVLMFQAWLERWK
ncbi:asparagine synthase (glutamine-hydrolyzing) [Methyloligella sp. 2.7D]|uniref:asparagine synthase (glutamine-hydrolyzing) n=1 Tax=unclassified Methyloligella TaxID=2625955 RepID=UPI00157E032C|nr:asparagine synthase (glutamine-hydrolyzing) [Methyloligella sp. GL2]QKP78084.1 asparagine synthase (glutamine-hydrolyzing) [Methyloligella sp. GL2]